MHIIELPTEIIEEILARCDPIEVSKAAQTCSALRKFIYASDDEKLWRDLYLAQPFDDLRKCVSEHGQLVQVPDWQRNLQRLFRARNVVANPSLLKPGELEEILQTLLKMILYHFPRSTSNSDKTESSRNLCWISNILRDHDFIDQVEDMKSSLTFSERQLLSRLHCYFGLTDKDVVEPQARIDSRVYVYTMRNYRRENNYGPFLSDGTVNWEHMQALHHVVSMHVFDDGSDSFSVFPMSVENMQVMLPDGQEGEEDLKDWVGLQGSWVLSFCFCDHRDLLTFNEASRTELDTSLFENPEFRELFRSLDVKLSLMIAECDPAHPTTPKLTFFGAMQAPETSTMMGWVKMTVDNQVHWHFISGDQGNGDLWSCEGVQVGGLRSSFGVLGSWTTKSHNSGDPVDVGDTTSVSVVQPQRQAVISAMSDQQPSPPPKPKPGSLRDRIAAFEKSATPAAATGQSAPAPRPKPSGFATWKPKVPSPPSSPSSKSIDNAAASSSLKAAGTMSASDAKESITKGGGGSLKDRMAALQGKGAFGAPAPPLAPKPAVDKPRWKPPPAVPAVDNDGHHEGVVDESPDAAIAAALDRKKSPPVSVKSGESLDLPKPITEGEETSVAEPTACAEGDADPEEEERQRRAAIAARMARLGGARLGMSPPVLAKKPPMPVRKPTREDVPKQEDREVLKRASLSLEDRGKNVEGKVSSPPIVDEDATVASQPSLTDVQSQSNIDLSPEYLPVRKNSENASLLSVDSADSNVARSSLSMPVPTVPRRAGPPRKKPVKPSAPPTPPVIAAPVIATPVIATPIIAQPVIATPPVIPIETVEEKAIKVPEHKDVGHEEIDNHQIHDEPQSIDLAVQHVPAVGSVAQSEEASSGESKEQNLTNDVQSFPLATIEASNESKQQHSHDRDHEHQHVDHQVEDDIINYSDRHLQDYEENHAAEHQEHHPGVQPEDDGNHSEDDIIDHSDEYSQDEENHAAEHEHQHLQQDDHYHPGIDVVAEPQPSSVVDVAVTEEEGEEARRKRVAERLAKMGGINPFAAPVVSPPLRRSSEDTGYTSLSPVVPSYAHASPPTAALPASPPRPDVPSRKASLRSYEVVEPHPLPVVESKVEEEQKEVDYSDEFADEEDSSDEVSVYEAPAEESLSPAHERSPQQAGTAPVRQLPDPILRPPISSSARPHVQMRQYGQHDEEEEDDAHPARRQLPPPSRLPGPPPPETPPLPPARPAQPPRRIVPQAPEGKERKEVGEEAGTDDDEEHEGLVPSHLFVRPPGQLGGGAVPRYPVRGGQRYETVEDDDGDGSENDTPALPKLQRKLEEVPPERSLPSLPPPQTSRHRHLATSPTNMSDPDSDHGHVLPVRPRHPAVPAPPTVVPVTPSVTSRRSVPSIPADEESFSSSYRVPSVAVSEHESEEILDEEEGDPIDPAFHSPSRRGSMTNLHNPVHGDTLGLPVQIPPPPVPVNVEKREEAQQQQDQEQMKRQTIAERMAKLGGIRFGAAPIPAAISRPPPPRVPQEEVEEDHHSEDHPQADAEDVAQPVEISEEEEERARKERIAAKLAGMGGMRIGMLPRGVGSPSPQRTHVLRDENVPPPSPTRALPPVRPPPPPTRPKTQDTDSERDDGVQVEAEESEIEEVNYEDAAELPVETPPPPLPPVPSGGRIAYHRESTDKTSLSPPPPPALIPGSRPPVPVGLPTRRSSVQASKSTGSVDLRFSPSRSTSSHVIHSQSDYVMVEEPQSIEEPISPSRRTSRMAPVRSPPNPMGIPQASDPSSISSQWELPSIPSAALDFGSGGDLSLSSWTDAGEPTSPTPSFQQPRLPSKRQSVLRPKTMSSSELQRSADDLMRMWGRVGVQVCEVATSLFENSKKTLIGDGTYAGFIAAVLAGVPSAAPISIASGEYGYLIYAQNGSSVQKRVSEILPGDIVEIYEGKLKGHKGIQTYHQNVGGSGEVLLGIVGEFEAKKSKIRVFHANQHVGQQTVESVSYRLEDLKSGTVKVYRVLELEV